MKQNVTFFVLVLLCFGITIFGFSKNGPSNQLNNMNNSSTLEKYNGNSFDKVSIVFPNPQSGTLNLHCPSSLIPPITIKAFNDKDNLVRSINSLLPEGANKHKFIQLNVADLEKGTYKIIFSDLNGKTSTRKIYIDK